MNKCNLCQQLEKINRKIAHLNQLSEKWKAKNYEELSQERNKIIVKYINQNTQQKLANPSLLPLNNHSERVIWIGLLVVSLIGIAGLMAKLKNSKSRK